MGLAIIVKAANFASQKVGELGIYTSINSGLVALHELRMSADVAIKNRGSGESGSVSGSPSFNNQRGVVDSSNRVIFGTRPTGDHTFASIFKIRPGSVTTGLPIGSYATDTATTGNEYIAQSTTSITLSARPFNNLGAVQPNITAVLEKPSTASHEMYVARFKNSVSARLDHPKSGASSTTATPYLFNYPAPNLYAATILGIASPAEEVSLFAHWNRAISDEEMVAFYTEMAAYFGNRGVVI